MDTCPRSSVPGRSGSAAEKLYTSPDLSQTTTARSSQVKTAAVQRRASRLQHGPKTLRCGAEEPPRHGSCDAASPVKRVAPHASIVTNISGKFSLLWIDWVQI